MLIGYSGARWCSELSQRNLSEKEIGYILPSLKCPIIHIIASFANIRHNPEANKLDSLSQAAPRDSVHKDSEEDRLTLQYLSVAEGIKLLAPFTDSGKMNKIEKLI